MRFWDLIRRWWYKDPGKVKKVKVNLMDRTISWTLPNVSNRQADIERVDVSFRVDEQFGWTLQGSVLAADPQEITFADVPAGQFFYQLVVVDVVGQEGPPVEVSAFGDYEVPGSVENVTITDV